jgi:hypothetical protein
MNVDISKEEYSKLLDLLHIATWVLHAHESEKDPRREPYDAVIQKFYALAKDMGQDKMIAFRPDAHSYAPTVEFENTAQSWEFIDEFMDDTFWDELVHRFADRDVARTIGGLDRTDKLNMTERFTIEAPVMQKYTQEFDEHGIDRLEIVEQLVRTPESKPVTHD